MSVVATPREAFQLQESLASRPSLDDDGSVLIHIIRPTIGMGMGRHKYTAEMLRENADVFTGWKMYIDHQSPEARKAAGGLPRSIRDLGGRILESWWDDTVPAEGRYEQGAVVGRVKPVGQVKALIEDDPELLEASIRAQATDVSPETIEGEQVWVVEGIRREPPGSVDWVSEGGAGGRIANLIEAMVVEDDETETNAEGGDSVKQLEEALRDPSSGVSRAVRELVESRASEVIETERKKHAQEIEAAREEAREEARAEAARQIALRDMREEAHRMIAEAALPGKVEEKLLGEYELEGDAPSTKLDLRDEVSDTDKVTKTAIDALRESVETDIREAREIIADVNPTKVEEQGPSDSDGETAPVAAEKPFYQEFLEEAGFNPSEVYGNPNDEKENG